MLINIENIGEELLVISPLSARKSKIPINKNK